ncbi:kinase-like domain-containing protein [Mycena rosella]|uniref:Kinase-like domain-containing protein n=1 Tax=Mycena rosella TaxID=1033263 RepID=A0AAD7G5Q3_MYCRO|nr:kinase-like domain-containing protein [Mycena rosella]
MNRRAAVSSPLELLEKDFAPELEDYRVMEQIGSGRISTVYLVNCKRGRLRNRQLALRRVSTSRAGATELSGSAAEQPDIFCSLHHPSIVSLFRTFSTPSARFQLLELCAGGTLASYLDCNSVTEAHLRGILKSLIEALTYLKKQGIAHRKITPSNLLLTADGRIKLCDFDLATYLPSSKVPPDCFLANPHFVAPELLADLPYGCEADLWSVGCIAMTCLSGRRPFEAGSHPETVEKILSVSYVLPETISVEIQDLVVGLLEIDPIRRIQLPAILSHPFFDISLQVTPLKPIILATSESVLSKHALFESNLGLPRTPISVFPSVHRRSHPYAPNKTVIDDMLRRDALRGETPARRIVSDPLPLKPRRFTPEATTPSSSSQYRHHKTPQQAVHRQNDRGREPTEGVLSNCIPHSAADGSPPTLPVGTTRPSPFTTALLSPETHKTVHGQITILPSCSLLVDLREGERRRGQKGAEVLLLDAQGTEIEVYSAPHLSLPCCLAEPTKRYTIEELPSAYWRQYNDAGLLVERIKQRTPKLILNAGAAKCTLMANAPRADIELLFGPPSRRRTDQSAETFPDAPRMRLRLSRQCGSLEIAKHVSSARGEEWTKQVLKTIDELPHISAADWDSLSATEQDGMGHLARFWRICEVLEQVEREDSPIPAPYPSSSSGASKSRSRTLPVTDWPSIPRPPRPAPTPASFSSTPTQTLSLVNIVPRPPKLAAVLPPAIRKTHNRVPSPSDMASIEGQHLSVTGTTAILPTWCRDDLDLEPPTSDYRVPQTKFIPSVGWCIRHSSRVSQGGRYKIMFFDGAVLEIDVDEDWAELVTRAGETTRHNIRDCNSKRHIAERMKVFGEFVSMFDETEEGGPG